MGVQIAEADMCGHTPRQIGVAAERFKLLRLRCVEFGQCEMRIDIGAAMAGHVLHHRLHPRLPQPLGKRTPQAGHNGGIAAERTIADHRIGPGHREVEHRGADHIEAQFGAEQPDRRPGELGGAQTRLPVPRLQRANFGRRREGREGRRAQPGDAAAFLIDHQHCLTRQNAAQIGEQFCHLRGSLHVAPEQYHARGRMCAQQSLGFSVENGAGNSDNGSVHAPFCHITQRSDRPRASLSVRDNHALCAR